MDLNRPFRILRHRWKTVVIIVAAVTAVAVWAANTRNDAIKPVFEASASITFVNDVGELESLGGSLLEAIDSQLEDARVVAEEINDDLLDGDNAVIADPALGRLTFVAHGSTPAEATAVAEEMRTRLVEADPFNIDQQIVAQIENTKSQLDTVRGQIDVLEEATAGDPATVSERQRLTNLIAALEQQSLDLQSSLLVPPTGEEAPTPEQIQADLTRVQGAIVDLKGQLAALPTPVEDLSTEATELRALQSQYQALETRYQTLLLQRSDLLGRPAQGVVEVTEETPSEVPWELAAGVALLLGLGLAVVVLMLSDRAVRPVWFPADVPKIPFLPSMPSRRRNSVAWYVKSGASPRKSAVQALRSTIRARVGEDEFVLAVVGAGVNSHEVHTLGADLASAFATTYADTTLIDAAFEDGPRGAEFRQAPLSLSAVLTQTSSVDQVHSLVDEASTIEAPIQARLLMISVGEGIDVPADAVAGPQIGHLFDVLRETQDVVVVIGDDVDAAPTQALVDRCDVVLVVTRPGRARRSTLVSLAEEMAYRQIDLIGAMIKVPFLPAPGGLTLDPREWWRRRRRSRSTARVVQHEIERPIPLAPAPAAQVARSARGQRAMLAKPMRPAKHSAPRPMVIAESPHLPELDEESDELDVVEDVATEEPSVPEPLPPRAVDDEPAKRKLTPVSDSDATEPAQEAPKAASLSPAAMFDMLESHDAAEVVAESEDFLMGWVTRVVTAQDGSGLSPETLADVKTAGFIPLSTWKDHPSLGSRLRHEFGIELGKKGASQFERLLLKSLSHGEERSDATSMDRWIGRRYFVRHARDEDWEPAVWHIMSQRGTISAVIASERFDRARIESFVDSVVLRAIDRLRRRQRRKELVGDQAGVAELGKQISDAREMALALAWLMDGTRKESRLWYPSLADEQQPQGWRPDWDQDVKYNLAPLQRMGILAAPILTASELAELDQTG